MLSKEEIKKQVLNTEMSKHPLLNEIYAIRDRRKETEDYTIYVDGYISVDVLNKTLELESNNKKLIEKLEEVKQKDDSWNAPNGELAVWTFAQEILEIAKGENNV